MADIGAIIAQAETAKAQFSQAESRGYARGVADAAKVCDRKAARHVDNASRGACAEELATEIRALTKGT